MGVFIHKTFYAACLRWAGVLLLLLVAEVQPFFAQGRKYISVQTGNWNNASTWTSIPSGGTTPGPNDTVIISATHTVSLSADASCNKIMVYGTFQVADRNFTCSDSAFIKSGGTITANSTTGNKNFKNYSRVLLKKYFGVYRKGLLTLQKKNHHLWNLLQTWNTLL